MDSTFLDPVDFLLLPYFYLDDVFQFHEDKRFRSVDVYSFHWSLQVDDVTIYCCLLCFLLLVSLLKIVVTNVVTFFSYSFCILGRVSLVLLTTLTSVS